MNKYRFYINDNEVNEPLNWTDINFQLAQDPNYWGYFRNGAIDKLQLHKESANLVKSFYDSSFTPITTYRIDKKNNLGLYDVYQNCVLDYSGYKESLVNNSGLLVEIDLIDSNLQGKLRNREGNELIIGRALSVENEPITNLPLIDVEVSRKVLKHSANFTFSSYLQEVDFYNGATIGEAYVYYPTDSPTYYYGEIVVDGAKRAFASHNVRTVYNGTTSGGSPEVATNGVQPRNYAHLALEVVSTNTDLSNSSITTNYNDYQTLTNLNGRIVPQLNSNDYKPTDSNMFWNVSGKKRTIHVEGTLDLNVIWRHNVPLSVSDRFVSLQVQLVKFFKSDSALDYYDSEVVLDTYIAPNHTLHAGDVLDPISTDTELPQYTTTQNVTLTYNETLLNEPGSTFGIRTTRVFSGANYEVDVVPLLEDNGTDLEVYYYDEPDEFPSSEHKCTLVYEALQNAIEQVTDKTDVFYSETFGRTDLGYSSDGVYSGLAITNGSLLRNSTFPNGNLANLTLNFADLYKTLDSLYGLQMNFIDGKIHIEKRSWSRTKSVLLTPKNVSIYPLSDKIYTAVRVGNEKLTTDEVNGTNEFNSILTFSSPINTKSNTLDLVTTYNTGYSAIEKARRLSISVEENVDTQYDDEVFLFEVVYDDIWKTKPILGNYTNLSGLILPYYAFNLGLSPKRMLINNIDIVNAMLSRSAQSLRFESADNLANVESQATGQDLVIEQSDLDSTTPKFVSEIYELTLGVNDVKSVFENTNNLYSFEYLNETLYGFLWDITETKEEVIVKLLKKYEQ